MPYQKAAMCTR